MLRGRKDIHFGNGFVVGFSVVGDIGERTESRGLVSWAAEGVTLKPSFDFVLRVWVLTLR